MKNKNKGFSTVEVLLLLVAVGIIGFTYWSVIQAKNKASQSFDAASSTTQNSISLGKKLSAQNSSSALNTLASPHFLSIKEWGVRIKLDSNTRSLYYVIKPTNPDAAYFSLKLIRNIAPKCAAENFSLAAIGRLTEAQQQDAITHVSNMILAGTRHIGNYWYSIEPSHAPCTDNTNEDAAISNKLPEYNRAALLNALNTITAE